MVPNHLCFWGAHNGKIQILYMPLSVPIGLSATITAEQIFTKMKVLLKNLLFKIGTTEILTTLKDLPANMSAFRK